MEWVDSQVNSASVYQPLQVTIGDEFQGAYRHLDAALQAVLLLQLKFADELPLRFGIGDGEIEAFDPDRAPFGQSGTAWWGARAAIERVKAMEEGHHAYRRCAFESTDRAYRGAIEAVLILRDRRMHDWDAKDRAIALGLMLGKSQSAIAEELSIDPAAVTRRKYKNGVDALLASQAVIAEVNS